MIQVIWPWFLVGMKITEMFEALRRRVTLCEPVQRSGQTAAPTRQPGKVTNRQLHEAGEKLGGNPVHATRRARGDVALSSQSLLRNRGANGCPRKLRVVAGWLMIGLEAAVVEDSGGARSLPGWAGRAPGWPVGRAAAAAAWAVGATENWSITVHSTSAAAASFSLPFCLLGLAPGAAEPSLAQGPRFCPLVVLGPDTAVTARPSACNLDWRPPLAFPRSGKGPGA